MLPSNFNVSNVHKQFDPIHWVPVQIENTFPLLTISKKGKLSFLETHLFQFKH